MEALKATDSQNDPEEKDPAGGITVPGLKLYYWFLCINFLSCHFAESANQF